MGVAVITSRCGFSPFAAQRSALRHAKAVLLIDHGQLQALELNRRFDQRVGANHQLDAAIFQPGADFLLLGFRCVADQQADLLGLQRRFAWPSPVGSAGQ
jgi:hypothetical protein